MGENEETLLISPYNASARPLWEVFMFWEPVCVSQQHWCKWKPFLFLLPTPDNLTNPISSLSLDFPLFVPACYSSILFLSALFSFPPSPHLSPSSLSLPILPLYWRQFFFFYMFCFPLILLFPGSHAVTQSLTTDEHWGCTPPEKHKPTRGASHSTTRS